MYRTAQWRRHQDQRRIRHWQHLYLNVFDCPQRNKRQYPRYDEQTDQDAERHGAWVWLKPHRFAKFTQSCDHHAICRLDRYSRRFRNYRGAWNAYWERYGVTGLVSCRREL